MRTEIFNSQEHMVSVDLLFLISNLVRKTGQEQIKEQIDSFIQCPQKDGLSIGLGSDAFVFLCVPDLLLGRKFKMGRCVWVYFTETKEWACLKEIESKSRRERR